MLPFEVATICLSTYVPTKIFFLHFSADKQLYQPRNEEKICALDT